MFCNVSVCVCVCMYAGVGDSFGFFGNILTVPAQAKFYLTCPFVNEMFFLCLSVNSMSFYFSLF
jgi:hypothetical protein